MVGKKDTNLEYFSDTLMNGELSTSSKKQKEDVPSPCKKRRRSCKGPEDVPTKRGRKPNNRSRHNSDSDDTSEHSMPGNVIGPAANIATRYSRSPGPSKYNFVVEFGKFVNYFSIKNHTICSITSSQLCDIYRIQSGLYSS